MSEEFEASASPGRTPARAPAFSLPVEWEGIAKSFRNHMVETASKETAKTYNRHVRAFLKFCLDQQWSLASIPPDGVHAYVAATEPKAAYHNLMTSALVSFRRWANAQGLVLAQFSIPATVRTEGSRRSRKQRAAAKAAKAAAAVVEAPPGPSVLNAFAPAARRARNDSGDGHPPSAQAFRQPPGAQPFASPFATPPQYADTFDEAPIVDDEQASMLQGVPSPAASPNLIPGLPVAPDDAISFDAISFFGGMPDDDDEFAEIDDESDEPNEEPNVESDHPIRLTEETTEQNHAHPSEETEDMSAAPTVPPITVVPNAEPAPAPTAPAAPPVAPVAAIDPTPAAAPTAPTPAFTPVPEPATARVGAPMAPAKVTAKREVANRAPLQSTMPANQRLRVTKLSDGSGPIPAGSSVLIGIYPSADVMRHGDPILFLNNVIRPAYGPRPGEPDAQYYIEFVNEWNQVVGAPCSVPIAAPLPGAHVPGVAAPQPAAQSNAQRQSQDDLIRDLVNKQQAEAKDHYNQMVAMLTQMSGKGGMDPAMLMLITQQMKPPAIDVEAIVRAAKSATGGGGNSTSAPPPSFTPLPLSALSGLGGDEGGGMAEITKTLVESLVKQQMAPQQDGFEKMLMMAKLMKEITGGGSDVMMRMMEDRNRRLEDELRDLKNKPTNNNLTETINSILAVQNLSEKLGGGNSRGSLAEMFLENFGEIGDGVSKVLKSLAVLKAPTAVAPPAAAPTPEAEEKKPDGQAKKVTHTLPAAAQNALLSMRDAKVTGDIQKDDQVILDAVFALVSALGSVEGPSKEFWGQRGMLILNALRQVTSRAELRGVVTNTFMACGATEIMTDPLVERITDVLAKNYTNIYRMIVQDEKADKVLKDAPPAGAVSGSGAPAPVPSGSSEAPSGSTKNVMNGSEAPGETSGEKKDEDKEDDEEDEEDGDDSEYYCEEDPPEDKPGHVCNKDRNHKGPHSWVLEEEIDGEE